MKVKHCAVRSALNNYVCICLLFYLTQLYVFILIFNVVIVINTFRMHIVICGLFSPFPCLLLCFVHIRDLTKIYLQRYTDERYLIKFTL